MRGGGGRSQDVSLEIDPQQRIDQLQGELNAEMAKHPTQRNADLIRDIQVELDHYVALQQQGQEFTEAQGTAIRQHRPPARRPHARPLAPAPAGVRDRPATRADVMRLLRTAQQQRSSRRPTHDIVIPPITSSGAIPIPIPIPGAAPRGKDTGTKITQKVIVQQGVKATKKKKRVSALTAKRKEYNALKKQLLAAFKKRKQETYKAENAKIKSVPTKERKAARQKLKQRLQQKLAELKKRLPAASKLKHQQLDKLISLAKTLKW